jgi:putative transposase
VRQSLDKQATPSLLAIGSQVVKKMQFINLDTGIDGGKRVNGRKRTILAVRRAVDTLGIPWSVKVTVADISDNQGGILAINSLKGKVPSLQKITADGGYKTTFVDYVTREFKWEVEIAQKPESIQGFVPQKNRWQVERSFGWLNFKRRLFRDVEKTVESAEAMIEIAFLSIFLNRMTKYVSKTYS